MLSIPSYFNKWIMTKTNSNFTKIAIMVIDAVLVTYKEKDQIIEIY